VRVEEVALRPSRNPRYWGDEASRRRWCASSPRSGRETALARLLTPTCRVGTPEITDASSTLSPDLEGVESMRFGTPENKDVRLIWCGVLVFRSYECRDDPPIDAEHN
jgi:hypothetical protein